MSSFSLATRREEDGHRKREKIDEDSRVYSLSIHYSLNSLSHS